ncbi:MAG: hypothetical protein ACI9J3_003816 [Parvicellaceae bacterium]|jgi:hypothetical protein
MSITIDIDESQEGAKAFLDFARTLKFAKIKSSDEEKLMNEEIDRALVEHENGSANYQDWSSVKEKVFEKHQG